MKHWSGMLIQSDGSKPYVRSAMGILADNFPCTIQRMGGFVDRDVRGHPGVKSMHSFGRAIDVYLDVQYPDEKCLAEALFDMFKANAQLLKTHLVIFNSVVWSRGSVANATTAAAQVRDPHTDHLHVDFTEQGMNEDAGALRGCILAAQMRMAGAGFSDRVRGFYGPAFNPLHPLTRLSNLERQAIHDLYMSVPPTMHLPDAAEKRAQELAAKLMSAHLLPTLFDVSELPEPPSQ